MFSRMADGRAFTDYRSRCSVGDIAQMDTNAQRKYLVDNGAKIMDGKRCEAWQTTRPGSCFAANESGTMLPEKSFTACNQTTCSVEPGSVEGGLGIGRKL